MPMRRYIFIHCGSVKECHNSKVTRLVVSTKATRNTIAPEKEYPGKYLFGWRQSNMRRTGDQEVAGSNSWMRVQLGIRSLRFEHCGVQLHSFLEIDHEIFSTVILSHLLPQEGQLSVSGNRMCTNTGKALRGLRLSMTSVVK